MYKNDKGQWIGHGEDLCVSILKELFPTADIQTQYHFSKLMKGSFVGSVTERQEKETLDIVIFREKSTEPIVVRVQDQHHKGDITSGRDTVQKKTLEWNDCVVVDVQHFNCPNIFKDKLNPESRRELLEAFGHEDIVFEQ